MNWESFKLGSKNNSTFISSYQSSYCYHQSKCQKGCWDKVSQQKLFVCCPGKYSISQNAVLDDVRITWTSLIPQHDNRPNNRPRFVQSMAGLGRIGKSGARQFIQPNSPRDYPLLVWGTPPSSPALPTMGTREASVHPSLDFTALQLSALCCTQLLYNVLHCTTP